MQVRQQPFGLRLVKKSSHFLPLCYLFRIIANVLIHQSGVSQYPEDSYPMFKPTSRWLLSAGLLLLVLIASACFQSVGDVPQGNAVSDRITETWTPVPTDTPIP